MLLKHYFHIYKFIYAIFIQIDVYKLNLFHIISFSMKNYLYVKLIINIQKNHIINSH